MNYPTMRRQIQCIVCAYENQFSPYSPLHRDTCQQCVINIEDGRTRIAAILAARRHKETPMN